MMILSHEIRLPSDEYSSAIGLPFSRLAPEPVFDLDGAKKGIAEANAKWIDGMKRGDAEAMSQLYMEDAILLLPNEAMVKGRKAIKDEFETMMKSWVKLTDMTLVTVEINCLFLITSCKTASQSIYSHEIVMTILQEYGYTRTTIPQP